jgi:ketosteroid isomerase-like protein
MTTATKLKAEQRTILDHEKQYFEALKRRDVDEVGRLTADPCVVMGQEGVRKIDNRSLRDMVKTQAYTLDDFAIDEKSVEFQEISPDVVSLAYKVHMRTTSDGKPSDIDAFDMSVWVRQNRDWVCTTHAETLVGR